MFDEIIEIRKKLKLTNPLIHSITNPISINQCANAIIAVGAKPIMAEHPQEVADITKTAGALMLNLGNITDVRMQSMMISAESASKNNIPFVIDVVGIACSELRRNYAYKLLKKYKPCVIKGNYSEIKALYSSEYSSVGVDSDIYLDKESVSKIAYKLAKEYNTIILASGKVDIVTDGNKIIHINNGTQQLSCITGTGCMQGALCSCYISVCQNITSVVTACAVMGICGELSETEKGNGTFMVNLMDNLSVLLDENIQKYLSVEEFNIE